MPSSAPPRPRSARSLVGGSSATAGAESTGGSGNREQPTRSLRSQNFPWWNVFEASGEGSRNESFPWRNVREATLAHCLTNTRATAGRLTGLLGALVGVRCVPGVLA